VKGGQDINDLIQITEEKEISPAEIRA